MKIKLIDTPDGRFASFLNYPQKEQINVLCLDYSFLTNNFNITNHEIKKATWKPLNTINTDGLIEIWFRNINPGPQITTEQAHDWLIKTALNHQANELHFRRRFTSTIIDRYDGKSHITGTYISALVSFIQRSK